VPLAQGMLAKLVADFGSIHGIGKILFVCKHQQHSITRSSSCQHKITLASLRAKFPKTNHFYQHKKFLLVRN
jgi:hypothetical protein